MISDVYHQQLATLPNSLMAARRMPNLSRANDPAIYAGSSSSKISREYFSPETTFATIGENNLPVIKTMNNQPSQVLSNGNVMLQNGNVVNGAMVNQQANMANAAASPVQQLGNGATRLSNGNVVAPNAAPNAVPVAVNANRDVVLSNGNTVSAQNIATMPQMAGTTVMPYPNSAAYVANNGMPTAGMRPLATANNTYYNTNNSVVNTGSTCPIAPPSKTFRYCVPAPFHSVGGAQYFYVQEAYGRPVAGAIV